MSKRNPSWWYGTWDVVIPADVIAAPRGGSGANGLSTRPSPDGAPGGGANGFSRRKSRRGRGDEAAEGELAPPYNVSSGLCVPVPETVVDLAAVPNTTEAFPGGGGVVG